jgi:hypothetical protein
MRLRNFEMNSKIRPPCSSGKSGDDLDRLGEQIERPPEDGLSEPLMAKVLPSEARPADACVIGIRTDRGPFSCSGIGRGYAHLGSCPLIGLPEAFSAYGPRIRLLCLSRLRGYKARDQ